MESSTSITSNDSSNNNDSSDSENNETNLNQIEKNIKLANRMNKLSCFRESPKPCINQSLVDQLAILRSDRKLKFANASAEFISYARAVSAIISCPFKITTKEEALALPWVGEKIAVHVEEFLETGRIELAQSIANSEEYQVLRLFEQIHGVGRVTAREFYNKGYRTLEDLELKEGKDLKYHADSLLKIPREEVESIKNFVQVQLDKIDFQRNSGTKGIITICGGYRRGKQFSNDIDLLIVYPHSQDEPERGLLKILLHRLEVKGFIPPDGILSVSHAASDRITLANKPASSFDCLDKAFIVFKHPANGITRLRPYYRRVDLIITSWKSYGSALLGWTGSTQWERDLRKHADSLGWIFESGGMRKKMGNDTVDFSFEIDIFRLLGLPWIEPTLRNADP